MFVGTASLLYSSSNNATGAFRRESSTHSSARPAAPQKSSTLEAISYARHFGETEMQFPRLHSLSPTSAKPSENGCVA